MSIIINTNIGIVNTVGDMIDALQKYPRDKKLSIAVVWQTYGGEIESADNKFKPRGIPLEIQEWGEDTIQISNANSKDCDGPSFCEDE